MIMFDGVILGSGSQAQRIQVANVGSSSLSLSNWVVTGIHAAGMTWFGFANTNNGIGTWLETNDLSSTFRFVDDYGPNTTGAAPTNGVRGYRSHVENTRP